MSFKNSIELKEAALILRSAYNQTYTSGSKVSVYYYHPEDYSSTVKLILRRTVPPKLLRDRFMMDCTAFTFLPFSFYFDILDRKLQQYIEADLINYNMREYFTHNNPKKFESRSEPFAVLTLSELKAGFVVSMLPLVLSMCVFIAEWIPKLKDFTIFMNIFKTYFDIKRSEQSRNFVNFK